VPAPASGPILVVNAGSSSVKVILFDAQLCQTLSGAVTEIGSGATFTLNGASNACAATDHKSAVRLILNELAARDMPPQSFAAAAHRVVHGGAKLTAPRRITPEIRAEIVACTALAPIHNPANLAAIDALSSLTPDLQQFASFDTAFHTTNPPEATTYPLPKKWRGRGLQRYGFHGISYSALVKNHPGPLPKRLLALHLGNGASLCAIHNGCSVATTMGYSPVSGLSMGSRVGDIDALAVLEIAKSEGIEVTSTLLNNASGLMGLAGENDMRSLMRAGTPDADFAISHFCYWAVRHAGSMVGAMGGLDGIAFTGGIGENAPEIRERILNELNWLGVRLDYDANRNNQSTLHGASSNISVHIVAAREERQIAQDALELM